MQCEASKCPIKYEEKCKYRIGFCWGSLSWNRCTYTNSDDIAAIIDDTNKIKESTLQTSYELSSAPPKEEKPTTADCWGCNCLKMERLSERPEGHWIIKWSGNGWNEDWDYTCSVCGKEYKKADSILYHANFCPNCGAIMRNENND